MFLLMQYILSWILSACFVSSDASTGDKYYLLFSKIDNRVEVYADDSLFFESGYIEGNPDLNMMVEFDPSNLNAKELRIRLLNGEDVIVEQIDRHWEITYEIFRNEEPIEYQSESGDDYKTGTVFDMTYDLEDL